MPHFNITPSTTPSGLPLCSTTCAHRKDKRCSISHRYTDNDEVCRPAVENMAHQLARPNYSELQAYAYAVRNGFWSAYTPCGK